MRCFQGAAPLTHGTSTPPELRTRATPHARSNLLPRTLLSSTVCPAAQPFRSSTSLQQTPPFLSPPFTRRKLTRFPHFLRISEELAVQFEPTIVPFLVPLFSSSFPPPSLR